MITKWDKRFLRLAELVASWSKDPSTKVGAVIVDTQKVIVSTGYNGFHRHMKDSEERYADREYKYAHIIHGEENAILFADRDRLDCATLYTVPFMPCSRCAVKIVQAGIIRVVSIHSENPRWLPDFVKTAKIFNEAEVELVLEGITPDATT